MGVIGIRILGCGVYGYKGLGFEVILITAGAIMKWRLLFHVRVAPGSEPSALNPDPGYDPCWFFSVSAMAAQDDFRALGPSRRGSGGKGRAGVKVPWTSFLLSLEFCGVLLRA